MASLFTPESERLRAGASKAAGGGRAPSGSVRVPGMKPLEGQKAGDSLGNPNSPGYEPWGRKKASSAEEKAGERPMEAGSNGVVIETTTQGPELIRLAIGWDRILLAQKKICEKAKGLFTLLEGPERYHSQKKSKVLSVKSRGFIVDVDIQEIQDEKEAEAKAAKEREPA